jgi:hypothetical protein
MTPAVPIACARMSPKPFDGTSPDTSPAAPFLSITKWSERSTRLPGRMPFDSIRSACSFIDSSVISRNRVGVTMSPYPLPGVGVAIVRPVTAP